MVVSARSRSIDGPWENSPYNPVVHTKSADEKWWSKGHGTLVEGPDGEWYLVYHAYEKGFYTLGRQTLLEPVKWTDDGWFVSKGDDVAAPIKKPAGGEAGPHGYAFSDDFSKDKIGLQWSFFNGRDDDLRRFRYAGGALFLQGKGTSPAIARRSGLSAATKPMRCRSSWSLPARPAAACCCSTMTGITPVSATPRRTRSCIARATTESCRNPRASTGTFSFA